MKLKEIIIDGFKSYASRTIVSGFDPSFTAITGLNGSGKSNILDSICFVLGISNLSQVRASSLSELIYKSGQAGVTRATVSLVFDNEDRKTSPVGYEEFGEITVTRQIVIGGKSKYLINGHVAPPTRIHNFFQVIGLNVNNPHFLVMQGRITKVINMKPAEILSLIEESAGVKMYETKKESAIKTIQKKASKVNEIDALLHDKINPTLQRLESERKHYMEWNKNRNDMETLQRSLIFGQYQLAANDLKRNSHVLQVTQQDLQAVESKLADIEHEKEKLVRKLKSVGSVSASNDALEEKAEQADLKVTKLKSSLESQTAALEGERTSLEALLQDIDDQKKALMEKTMEHTASMATLKKVEMKAVSIFESVQTAQTAMFTCPDSVSLQMETAQRELSVAKSELDSLKVRSAFLTKEHGVKAGELEKHRAEIRRVKAESNKAEEQVTAARLAVLELDYDTVAIEAVAAKLTEEQACAAALRERVDTLSAKVSAFDFKVLPGIDKSKIYGTIAKLIRPRDISAATALEVTAGGKLYHVVVDSDETANTIFKNGKLNRRITILPLNKIRGEVLSRNQQDRAAQIQPNCQLALHIIDFPDDVANAVAHVFGRSLICPDMDSAKRVTFDKYVRTRCVTLDGDVYDPSGTLSGGSSSRGRGPSVLIILGELADAQIQLQTHEKNITRLLAQRDALDGKSKKYRQLTATLEIKEHEAKLLEDRLACSASGRLLAEVEALHLELSEKIPSAMKVAQATISNSETRIASLSAELVDADSARDRIQAESEASTKALKANHVEAMEQLQLAKDHRDSLAVQVEALSDEINRLTEQQRNVLVPSIGKLSEEVNNLSRKLADETTRFEVIKADLDAERKRNSETMSAISNTKHAIDDLTELGDAAGLERSKLQMKLREVERGRVNGQKLIAKLKAEHPWITHDRSFRSPPSPDASVISGSDDREDSMGVLTNGDTDSASIATKEQLARLRSEFDNLQARQEKLASKVNRKAVHMFETAKDEYNQLIEKKRIIEQDKTKIEQVIDRLDSKKRIALDRTWKEVNKSFGEIFSELLPGVSAKLEPPNGKTVEEGLEIRVAFGAVWKESLLELSGGQRSLIALSLILAMLRFKPAPMYILDEVDAALDLSHTQNIGRMLRRHFSNSQFIVVSLKEGMFNNANVIFRTKFVDGISTVTRTSVDQLQKKKIGADVVAERDNYEEDKENHPNELIVDSPVGGRRKKRARA